MIDRILFEDNHHLVVNKPPGLLVQGDDTGDATLLDLAKEYIKTRYNKPGNVYLGLIHRLDRPASGVVVLAKTSKAASRLSAQFRERKVEKHYLIRVRGRPKPAAGTLEDKLLRQGKSTTIHSSGKAARLHFQTFHTGEMARLPGNSSIIAVHLETGRRHQIRVQFGRRGHPILGDLRYGASVPFPDKSIALHAHRLTIDHATTKERMTFQAPPPEWAKIPVSITEVDWATQAKGIQAVRNEVFVREQNVPAALESDGTDPDHRHWLALTDTGRPVATARLSTNTSPHGTSGHIGRVAVLAALRGQGIGHQLMKKIIADAAASGMNEIDLNSQLHAKAFYESLGFRQAGGAFEEAGIAHIHMAMPLPLPRTPKGA